MDTLPIELLHIINDELGFTDQLQLKSTSKWLQHIIKIETDLPSLLFSLQYFGDSEPPKNLVEPAYYVMLKDIKKFINKGLTDKLIHHCFFAKVLVGSCDLTNCTIPTKYPDKRHDYPEELPEEYDIDVWFDTYKKKKSLVYNGGQVTTIRQLINKIMAIAKEKMFPLSIKN